MLQQPKKSSSRIIVNTGNGDLFALCLKTSRLNEMNERYDNRSYKAILSNCNISLNPLRPNSDLKQTSHYNIKGLSVSEVMRIENMITQVKFY